MVEEEEGTGVKDAAGEMSAMEIDEERGA